MPDVLRTFRVENFRGFRDLTIEPLERVNLIAGKNNTGKTSLLEAIYLFLNTKLPVFVNINELRGISSSPESFFDRIRWLFPVKDTPWGPIVLSGRDTGNITHKLIIEYADQDGARLTLRDLSEQLAKSLPALVWGEGLASRYEDSSGHRGYGLYFPETPHLSRNWSYNMPAAPPNRFLTSGIPQAGSVVKDYSEVEKAERQEEILPALRQIEPRLRYLSLAIHEGKPTIFGNLGLGRLIPLNFVGEGMRRLLSIELAIANCPGGVVLIDEVENGLHHSVLRKVWEAIGDAARRVDAQVFATTHSYECIQAAHEAFSVGETYDLGLHRLVRADDSIKAVAYDRETLGSSVEMNLEVR